MKSLYFFTILFVLVASCAKPKPTSNTLKIAIQNDDLASFQSIRNELDIDRVKFQYGGTALHYALRIGAHKISEQLIKDDYKLNAADSLNYTPLLIASVEYKSHIVDLLLERNVDISVIENHNGYSALHYAAYYNNIELLKKLLNKNVDVNLKNESLLSSTAYHIAIEEQHIDVINFFIDNKVTDTIKDANRDTPIDLAISSNNPSVIELFYHNFNQIQKEELFIETARNTSNIDFLKKIISNGNIPEQVIKESFVFVKDTMIAQVLLDSKAKVNYMHPKYNYGAIHYAAIRGDTNMLRFLIGKGGDVNQVSLKNPITPLMHATNLYIKSDFFDIDMGGASISANPEFYYRFQTSKEKTKTNSLEAVKLLVNNNANINYKNRSNENALYYAESALNKEVVDYLKAKGAKESKEFKDE